MDIASSHRQSSPAPTAASAAHLVDALLERGAPKVYAARPRPGAPSARTRGSCPRLRPARSASSIAAAARARRRDAAHQQRLDRRVRRPAGGRPAPPCAREMAVNYDGTVRDDPRLRPGARAQRRRRVVNVLSLLSLASTPPMTGYSASKAAAHSLTQALRPVLAAAASPFTASTRPASTPTCWPGIDVAQDAAPAEVAAGLLDGLAAGEEDIFPDPNAQAMATVWWARPEGVRARLLGRRRVAQ